MEALLPAVCVALTSGVSVQAEVVNRIWTGETSFNEAEISVPAIEVAQFTGISSPASLYRAWWPGDTTFSLDIRLDGSWLTVWEDTVTLSDGVRSLESGVNSSGAFGFERGFIDGIRFRSSNVQSQNRQQINFLNSGQGTRFFFDTESIPGPGAAGLGVIVLAMSLRRR